VIDERWSVVQDYDFHVVSPQCGHQIDCELRRVFGMTLGAAVPVDVNCDIGVAQRG
jgi:hypothetical protein